MKKNHQKPTSIEEQINNLINLGLIISDKTDAERILKRISYYRIIKAYSITLKKNKKYLTGIELKDIVNLYTFDKELRHLLFSVIEDVEVHLRAAMTNFFSLKYGNFGYQSLSNFKNQKRQEEVLQELEKEITRNNRSPFIKNFQDNYVGGKIPLYAVIEVTSFGVLSKMYKNMKNEDKKEIAKEFHTKYFYLESWIENLAYVRNICAHYGRLYGARLTKTPKLYEEYLGKVSNNTIFATILYLKDISNEISYRKFYKGLTELVKTYSSIDLKPLGFIDDWGKKLRPWK